MKPVKIYTKGFCPHCTRVKQFFDGKGVSYEEVDVTNDPEMLQQIVAQTNMRTVPQVFIGDEFVGGCDDVLALDKTGGVDALLGAA